MSLVGFIGTGHIAAPMARHLAAKGHEIIVTARNHDVSAALARDIGAEVSDAQGVLDRADIVFLCLRPHVAEAILDPLDFRAGQSVVSVMAGIARADLERICAPASDFTQTIPLGFLEDGGCPLASFGNTALLTDLFGPQNPVVPVRNEAALNGYFAICAMIPGLVDLMATGSDWLTRQTGDAEAAEFFTTQLAAGFLTSMDKGAGRLAAERDALATEGTISLMMTETLHRDGAHDALLTALDAIGARLEGRS